MTPLETTPASHGPIAPDQAGCCGYATAPHLQSATHCDADPVWAGTVTFTGHGRLPAFACDEHRQVLEEPTRIAPGDRYSDELERRRALRARAWSR